LWKLILENISISLELIGIFDTALIQFSILPQAGLRKIKGFTPVNKGLLVTVSVFVCLQVMGSLISSNAQFKTYTRNIAYGSVYY